MTATTLALAILMICAGPGQATGRGVIAVAAEGESPGARVSGVAARSPFFQLFDADGVFLEAIDNPHRTAGRRTSGPVAAFLAQKGVSMVVAGDFGDKMIQALKARGLRAVKFMGSASQGAEAALKAAPASGP